MTQFIKVNPSNVYVIDFFGSNNISASDIRACIPDANDDYEELKELPNNMQPMSWQPYYAQELYEANNLNENNEEVDVLTKSRFDSIDIDTIDVQSNGDDNKKSQFKTTYREVEGTLIALSIPISKKFLKSTLNNKYTSVVAKKIIGKHMPIPTGASKWTNVGSIIIMRTGISKKISTLKLPAPVIRRTGIAMVGTVGFRVITRWIPYVGAALLAIDAISLLTKADDNTNTEQSNQFHGGGGGSAGGGGAGGSW